jgi:hypothetical protein
MEKKETIGLIKKTIEKFCESFDKKDWMMMNECLMENIYVDYSSFRKTTPGNISAKEFIELRKTGLQHLTTKHQTNNFQITFNNEQATCECDFVIQRFDDSGKYFHSYGHYTFLLSEKNDACKIESITQVVLKNEGDSAIHGAFLGK